MYERLYTAEQQEEIVTTIRDIVAERQELPEYVDRYAGIEPADIDSLQAVTDLPLLSDEALTPAGAVKAFFQSRRANAAVTKASSGTTSGVPTVCFWSDEDIRRSAPIRLRDSLQQMSSGRVADLSGDRLLVICMEQLLPGFGQAAADTGPLIAAGSPQNLEFAAGLATAVEPTAMFTTPTIAQKLGERIEEFVGEIGLLVLTGEPLSSDARERLRDRYDGPTIVQTVGSSETAQWGFQCPENPDENTFHFFPDDYFMEIVDPDSGEQCDIGEDGELVATTLWEPTGIPLIRYRTGDRAAFVEAACDCGASNLRVHLLGRLTFDSFDINGMTISRKTFEDGISAVGDIGRDDYQIHLFSDRVALYLVLPDSLTEDSARETAETLMDNIVVSSEQTWKAAMADGLLPRIEVSVVDELPGGVKTPPVIDHREEPEEN